MSQYVERSEASNAVDVSVVIVSYNCRDYLLSCLDSLLGSCTTTSIECIIVDNDSRDDSVAYLRRRHPGVRVIPMGRNAGFSCASNVGIYHACGKYILLLNPDTRVHASAIDQLAAWLSSHPLAGAVAPRLVNPDGTDQRTARGFPTVAAGLFGRRSPLTRWMPHTRWARRYLPDAGQNPRDPYRIDWVSGAAMMVPASVVKVCGGLDERFFLFWEDADWCKRIGAAGYQVWCVPAARVTHDEGGTRNHRWSLKTSTYFHRGAYLYWRKHHAPQAWNPARWVAAIALAARALTVVLLGCLRSVPGRLHRPVEMVGPASHTFKHNSVTP